jgi:glycosyltransferase involved in cell wall biosynthesis
MSPVPGVDLPERSASSVFNALRPGLLARRVMRLLHLGGAWNRCALWIDRRRPPVQPDGWSSPLFARSGSSQAPNPLAGPVDTPQQASAAAARQAETIDSSADGSPLLRCLLVTHRLDAGGVQEVVAFLARRLPSRGWQTAVICTSPDAMTDGQVPGVAAAALRSAGVQVLGADGRRALEWARQWRPDVISGHIAPAWAFAMAKRLDVPYVDNLHNLNGLGRDWRWHSAGVRSGNLACVVAVSDVLRLQQLACNPEFPPERVVTVPNGVDGERFAFHDRAAARDWLGITDQFLFVTLGRYCMSKNGYGLITAFGDLASSRPDVHLVLAGRVSEPRYYRRVRQLRDAMPCRDRVHLRGNTAEPARLLAAADGFVLDSFFEGWPLASMEALCAGLPVIMTDVSGAHEQIGGDPARGYVVANPLGDPLKADWASSAAAQYRPQQNRAELAATMALLVKDRTEYLSNRDHLAAESAVRFNSASWLARHDAVLRAAAAGVSPPTEEGGHHASPVGGRLPAMRSSA